MLLLKIGEKNDCAKTFRKISWREVIKMIKLPKRFWDDKEWIFAHYSELLRTYRNMWIAVLNKKIIAASPNLGKVEEIKAKIGKKHIPVIFLEDGSHVY